MMTYDMLSFLGKAVLRFCLFAILCVSIYLLFAALRKKSLSQILPTSLSVLLSGGMLILYSTEIWSQRYDLDHQAAARWFCETPILFTVILIAAAAVLLIYDLLLEMHLRRTVPGRSAIKESIDHLPTGLCFYAENGRIMLVNHRMNRLCHILLGRDLQNAALMWDDLCAGNILPDIQRLSMGAQPSFRLPDGTVWSFSRTELDGVLQLTAVDTTQLHALAEELEQKNLSLEALYQRLKQYEENVEELTRSHERLETKIGIHSELGQTLLVTRSYLLSDRDDKAVPADAWKNSLALLRRNAAQTAEHFTVQTLVQTADAFGIRVNITGEIPKQKKAEVLFLGAAAEALTNAVRHADAKTLYISFSETDTDYQVSFRNDGRQPEGEITESGGLSSLRRKIETAGGMMLICAQPEYELIMTMKKGGTEGI